VSVDSFSAVARDDARMVATSPERQCTATTRAGNRCPTGVAGSSRLCHVHDPELQCGQRKANGERCGVATGGGPCAAHDRSPGIDQDVLFDA
jgi:ribonuclease HI